MKIINTMKVTEIKLVMLAALALLWTARTALATATPPADMTVELEVPRIDQIETLGLGVTEILTNAPIVSNQPFLEIPFVVFNVPTVASQVINVTARDDRGTLPLRSVDVGAADQRIRRWMATRAIQGSVVLQYRAPLAKQLAPRGAAPPLELRLQDGAVSGSGATFLLRPITGRFTFHVRWQLPPGANAISTLDGLNSTSLSADTLSSTYFAAGLVHVVPGKMNRLFRGAWVGNPNFSAEPLLQWAGQLYSHYETLFSAENVGYTVFMRPNPVNPNGGYGLHRAFIVTFGSNAPGEAEFLKSTLAHEMFHTFQPQIWKPSAADGSLDVAWFDEGLAVFYQNVLPYRYGMMSDEEFLRGVNQSAAVYYANPFIDLPNADIPGRFWSDTRVRLIPYERGFVYFSIVDAALRKVSGGRSSLDDIVLELRRAQNNGQELTPTVWSDALRAPLGERGQTAFQEMLAGHEMVPDSDVFGPCFQRVRKFVRRYELGFDPKVLTEQPRIVRGILPDSEAARSGLRNGDEIVDPVSQDAIQMDQTATLKLNIMRGAARIPITYLPRGERVSVWQWERKASARPGEDCRLPGR